MTGKQVMDTALVLLGITDESGAVENGSVSDLYRKGQIFLQLLFEELARAEGLSEEAIRPLQMEEAIPLSKRACGQVLPYGLAAYLALAEGDLTAQSIYAALYDDQKRYLMAKSRREDVFGGGGL